MFARSSIERYRHISYSGTNSKKHILLRQLQLLRPAPIFLVMVDFDYTAPAELFACRGKGSSPRPITYRRFESGAKAIRFAIEQLPQDMLFGTVLEADEQRFDAAQIRALYESQAYPLPRRKLA